MATSLSSLEKVREELICAVCLDFLQEPKVLLCAHSFCLQCLESISTTQRTYKFADNPLQDDELECPSCRHVTRLPEGRAKKLRTNYNLKRLVDIVSEEEKRMARDVIRRRGSVRPTIDRQKQPQCLLHSKPLEYFCVDCNELLCRKCMIAGHRDHNYQDVDEILPNQLAALRNLIQPACEVASRAETMMEQLFKDRDIITTNSAATSDAVRDYFDKLRRTMDKRETALLNTVRKYSDIKLTRLDVQYQNLQNDRDMILQLVDTAKEMLQHSEDVMVIVEKQRISEEVDVHEQSVLSTCDVLEEARHSNAFLSFKEDHSIKHPLSELGTLNECRREPDSMFLSMRRVVVSEEEDPYLDVPLRFEDNQGSTQTLRFDETQKQQMEDFQNGGNDVYASPKPLVPPPKINLPKPPPHKPKVPPSPLVSPLATIPEESHYDVPPRPPKPSYLTKKEGLYDAPRPAPRPAPRSSSNHNEKEGLYDTPRPAPISSPNHNEKEGLYDTPRPAPISSPNHNEKEGLYDTPRSASISSTPPPLPPRLPIKIPPPPPPLPPKSDDDDDDSYEPVYIRPIPKPRVKPPPLPPNHPSVLKPVPRPRSRTVTLACSPTDPEMSISEPIKLKRRSQTLPADVDTIPLPLSNLDVPIIQPVKILGNEQLRWPSSHETIYPCAIACIRSQDILVVSDIFNHCMRLIDRNGEFIGKIGKEGRSGGQFKEPSAIAVSADSHIFVAERDNPRVQKFTNSGKYVLKFGQKALWGSQLSEPWGVAISVDGNVFITDWDKSVILVFTSGGKYLRTIGKENGFLKFPAGIAFDVKGRLLVVDRGNHCVWILTPQQGDIIGKIGHRGSKPGQLYYPYGIAVTEDGFLVVSESGNNRISVFSPTGDFVRCFGKTGCEPGMFDHPRHVCVDSNGQIAVADEMNQRIQIFQLT